MLYQLFNATNQRRTRRCFGEPGRSARRRAVSTILIGFSAVALASGCSSKTYLMPTPNAYTHPTWNPFADVPPALQGDEVSVLYVTDRAAEEETADQWEYGYERSRSAAFGEAVVQIGLSGIRRGRRPDRRRAVVG